MTGAVRAAPRVIVVMGVAGSGKTTTAIALSERLGWPFRDADSFHPPANVAKMASGQPLTDEDRWPWLHAIAAWIDARLAAGERGVVTCSALKRAYRDVLLQGRSGVALVYLKGDKTLIAARMAARRKHFMPPALLDSQFATLEEPTPDEGALTIAVDGPPGTVVEAIVKGLGLNTPSFRGLPKA